jgi:NAD kinase
MNILLFVNPQKYTDTDGEAITKFLQSKNHQVTVKYDLRSTWTPTESYDLAITMGGDGSVISMFNYMSNIYDGYKAPVVGINYGKLGYLAHFQYEEFLK